MGPVIDGRVSLSQVTVLPTQEEVIGEIYDRCQQIVESVEGWVEDEQTHRKCEVLMGLLGIDEHAFRMKHAWRL